MQAMVRSAGFGLHNMRVKDTTKKEYRLLKQLFPIIIYAYCIRKICATKKPITMDESAFLLLAYLKRILAVIDEGSP